MPIAICLRADQEDLRPILELQDAAAAFTSEPSLRRLGYGPHITLAIYEVLAARDVEAAASQLFERCKAVVLQFKAVRWFDGPELTLYAAPEPSPELDELHAYLHRMIPLERCHAHYRPGNFIPHCTLAANLTTDRHVEAIAFARLIRMSLRIAFTKGDVVSFHPPRVLRQWRLGTTHRDARHPCETR